MKRFIIPAVFVCALVGGLSGCGAAGPQNVPDTSQTDQNQWFSVHHVPVDGRTVTCLKEENEGSISCDWANAK